MTDAAYVNRMREVFGFRVFSIEPQWMPSLADVEAFCHDEVVRQGHNTRVWEDGGRRVEQMVDAWNYAEGRSRHLPAIEDVLTVGRKIEPDYNRDGFRHENVYVGDRMGVYPPYLSQSVQLLVDHLRDPGVVEGASRGSLVHELQVEALEKQLPELVKTVDDWYLAFEWVHPFRDGNGRSGKVLYNWLLDTLDAPVLVPDYFRGGNP